MIDDQRPLISDKSSIQNHVAVKSFSLACLYVAYIQNGTVKLGINNIKKPKCQHKYNPGVIPRPINNISYRHQVLLLRT